MHDIDAVDQGAGLPGRAAGHFRRRLWRLSIYGILALLVAHAAYSGAYYAWNWDFSGNADFSDDFETGTLDSWRRHGEVQLCCPTSAVFVKSERKPDALAVLFSLHSNDADVKGSKRAELRLKAAPFGQDRWYLASLRIPADWVSAPERTTVLQWHAVDDKILGEVSRSPPLRLMIQNREWVIVSRWDPRPVSGLPLLRDPDGGGERIIWRGHLDTGVSSDWLFRVRWSHTSDGVVAVWKDGKQIACYEGPNAYNDLMGPYLKVGIYVPSWTSAAAREITRRELIVERVRQSAYPLASSTRSDVAPVASTDRRTCY